MDGPIPLPLWDMQCPCCRDEKVIIRDVQFHTRDGSPSKYRCLVKMKCTNCSHVFLFGVVIPQSMFDKYGPSHFTYHEIKRMIEG